MTDEKSIEAPPENPDADRHALGDDILVRLDRDERLFATCGDPETALDCRDAQAEIRRLREELAEERAPLTREEWSQLISLVNGAPYPAKTPDACLLQGLQSWAKEEHGRVVMRRLLELLEAETARRESAEAALRDARPHFNRAISVGQDIDAHFQRYAPSGSEETKETDR